MLSWNCQGLANLRPVPVLKDLFRFNNPDVNFFFRNFSFATKVDEVRMKIGFDYFFSMDDLEGVEEQLSFGELQQTALS